MDNNKIRSLKSSSVLSNAIDKKNLMLKPLNDALARLSGNLPLQDPGDNINQLIQNLYQVERQLTYKPYSIRFLRSDANQPEAYKDALPILRLIRKILVLSGEELLSQDSVISSRTLPYKHQEMHSSKSQTTMGSYK